MKFGSYSPGVCLGFAAGLLFALSYPAAASTLTYDFSFSGSGITSSGVFTVSDVAGTYTVTNMTGTYDSLVITGLLGPGTYQSNDNQISPSAPFLDFDGVSFAVGASDYNVFYDNGHNSCETTSGYYVYVGQSATATTCGSTVDKKVNYSLTQVVTPTPEPSSALLTGLPMAFLFGLAIIRRRSAAATGSPAN